MSDPSGSRTTLPGSRPFLYLIGPSGSGKSTVLAAALAGIGCDPADKPFGHITYRPSGAVQIGTRRSVFPGTDGLPMDAIERVLPWLRTTDAPAVIAEGDRLSNERFFVNVITAGFKLTVAYLDLDEVEAKRRRDERGSAYTPGWAQGRHTKSARLAGRWGKAAWWLDARQPVNELAARLREHPAIQIARGER